MAIQIIGIMTTGLRDYELLCEECNCRFFSKLDDAIVMCPKCSFCEKAGLVLVNYSRKRK